MATCSNCNLESIQKPQETSDDNHMPMDAAGNSNLEPVQKPQVIYRCKKCRRIVAVQENLVPHERGKGESCFKWQKRSGDALKKEKEPVECTSIFVEPMKWMETGIGQYKKVMCKRDFCAWAAMPAWVTSTGQVCNAAVELGLILHFNFTKAD